MSLDNVTAQAVHRHRADELMRALGRRRGRERPAPRVDTARARRRPARGLPRA